MFGPRQSTITETTRGSVNWSNQKSPARVWSIMPTTFFGLNPSGGYPPGASMKE